MSHVAIVGSGNVGANTAFYIAETGLADVRLYDNREGLAAGKALDMLEAAPIRRYRSRLSAVASLDELAGAETVVVAAGKVRSPGMRRQDLLDENAPLIADLAPRVAALCPQAIVLVATEPVDAATMLFHRLSGMPRTRVLGIGGCLDAVRLCHAVARALRVSHEDVAALVLGRHAEDMLIPPRYCTVSGVPITALMKPEELREVLDETREAGDSIVGLAQRSSSYYAPSAAAAEIAAAIRVDMKRVFSVSVPLQGEYGIEGVALSLPAVIGKGGAERLLTPSLEPDELDGLRASARELAAALEGRIR